MLRSLKLYLRFLVPLGIALSLLAYAVIPLVDSLMLRWAVHDIDVRSNLIARTLSVPLSELLPTSNANGIRSLFTRAIQGERLYALAFCDASGTLLYKTETFPDTLGCNLPELSNGTESALVRSPQGSLHVSKRSLQLDGGWPGDLVLVHDMSFAERRSADTRRYIVFLFAILAAVVSLITVAVAQLSWRGWVSGVRALLRGEGIVKPFSNASSDVQPLVGDLRAFLRQIDEAYRAKEDTNITWTPHTLRELLHKQLSGDQIIVVSNREPYIHVRSNDRIQVSRPASGLVTAVEPVMRACSGTWVAHGSGSADRETVDRHDCVRVPPENPSYTLRRIWLTQKEEQGYYYGFANEGLWPLCHVAHVRPIFRDSDWAEYKRVNKRFADAVVAEATIDDPVILVQDYHFALVPRLIRERLPKATIITFWHIPWPNLESFSICPWREELLSGLLGSTILGFHTPYHCKNFIETVDRFLETRIEHEHSTISYGGEITLVESYPISIHWPSAESANWKSLESCRADIRQALGLEPNRLIGIGIDRLDYTKGIVERFQAVERMLELHPEMIGKFSFVQIAAPSRSSLDDYRHFEEQVKATEERINRRFSNDNYRPIYLKIEHHNTAAVFEYYRAADVCVVTSLHDGMNLVAKEFIAARDDERGVLVLSQFAGAARELHEALIVNPYHIEQTANAIFRALTMPSGEQCERMRSMRVHVHDFNVYRWAGKMLLDAARLRQRQRVAARIRSHAGSQLARTA